MTNISEIINKASLKSKDWRNGEVETILQSLQEIPKVSLDWDKSDGETWARLIHEGNVIAYVSIPLPIIICLSKYAELVLPQLGTKTELCIVVEDFEEHIFSVDLTSIPIIENIFGRLWSSKVNPQQFSINEFWWTTI